MISDCLHSLGFQQSREVEIGPRHFFSGNLESSLCQGLTDNFFFVQVSSCGFAGSREKFTNLLQECVVPCLWRERNNDTVFSERAQVANHLSHFIGRVVDGDINACHGVVFSLYRFQIGCVEFSVESHFTRSSCGLVGHGVGNITRGNLCSYKTKKM